MNALVSLDSILEPAQALTATSLFGSGQVETILAAIEKDVRAELFDLDTDEGRERIKSVAYKIARSKTTLDEIGKEHVAHIKAQSTAIDRERKTLRDRLDALKDEVRGPLTAWEEAEAARITEHAQILAAIVTQVAPSAPASAIREMIVRLDALAGRDWQEFAERAVPALAEAKIILADALAAAEQREREGAELEALRKEKAERAEQDAKAAWQEAENERMRKAAEEAAERERRRAEQQAERDRQMAERAAAEAIAAAGRAVEMERQRVAAERVAAEAAERKRQENKRHRERIHSRIKGALLQWEIGDEQANDLIGKIAAGEIPHVSIEY